MDGMNNDFEKERVIRGLWLLRLIALHGMGEDTAEGSSSSLPVGIRSKPIINHRLHYTLYVMRY